jgi:hypothetical protein
VWSQQLSDNAFENLILPFQSCSFQLYMGVNMYENIVAGLRQAKDRHGDINIFKFKQTEGRCYDHSFLRFLTIFGDKN